MSTFLDRLASKLELTLAGTAFTIEAKEIESFSLNLHPWGFDGHVSFWVICVSSPDEDEVFSKFIEPDLGKASLTLKRAYDEPDETASPAVIKGVIYDRQMFEQPVEEMTGAPIMMRKYTIYFADLAQVLWRQHYPTVLLVDSSYATLIDGHKPTGLTLTHSWTPSSTTHQVLSLGLGVDGNRASFYDFIHWVSNKHYAALFYDYSADSYKIADAKPTITTPLSLEPQELELLEVVIPPIRRDKVTVLNAYTDASTKKKEGTNDDAATGIRSDFLIRSSIAADLDNRSTLEGNRAKQRESGAKFTLQIFPASPFVPNVGLKLGDDFSTNLYAYGKTYRVMHVTMTAQITGQQLGPEASVGAQYEMTYEIEAEQSADLVFHYPTFARPVWPFYVEGKVVSEQGETADETYQFYTNSSTSIDQYKVEVPLFENKKVVVTYEPIFHSGQFYFPAYKKERVLLALHFDEAKFTAYLDWRAGGRLPLDTQGNHLLMGKKATSQTSVQHIYQDAKPVLAIKRTSDKDEQTIKVFEGTITMVTKENE